MEKILKRTLSLVFCLCILISTISIGFSAAAIGKVQNLTYTARTTNSISLKWSAVSGAEGYRIYSYDFSAKKWNKLKNTTATSYAHKKLTSGKLYAYVIRALDKQGDKYVLGEMSNIIKVVTNPGNISTLAASNITADSVTLKWTKATGADGYFVYQKNTSTGKYVRIATTADTSYVKKNLSAYKSYDFAVQPFAKEGTYAYGKSSYINVVTKKDVLDTVTNLRIDKLTDSGFRLLWNKVSGATGYQVFLYNTNTEKWVKVTTTKNNYVLFSNIKNINTYTLSVRAYRAKSGGGYTYSSLCSGICAFAKPVKPSNLTGAQNTNNGISLKWDSVKGAHGYRIYAYDSIDAKWKLLVTTTKNYYNINGITQTSAYTFKVTTCKKSGNKIYESDMSSPVTVAYQSHENPDSIYSAEMEKSGVLGYLYDPKGMYFYTSADPWQRNFGFNSLYDTAAPFTLINYDTLRLRFDYGSKNWMIQIWKGQYGLVFYGGEVGVYTKPKDREVMHFDCANDSELLKMSMTFNEKIFGKWYERFTRPYGDYWWCTGFLPGNKLGNFSTIRLDLRITAMDYTMLEGFKSTLKQNNVEYTVKGLDVYFSF